MDIWKNAVLGYLGGCGYVGLELLWRGRSHSSMFVAGGVCFILLGRLREVAPRLPGAVRAAMGAAVITGVELGTGLLVNRDFAVWDYRDQPGNFLGQICPVFSLLWLPVSAGAMALYGQLEKRIRT